MITGLLQRMVAGAHRRSCQRCNDWSGRKVAALRPRALLDVGCADGSFLFGYLEHKPEQFCGIEASPALRAQAEAKGIRTSAVDLNGLWPYADNTFDVVHCSQVIEHLHNTRLFVQELLRVLQPGGTALVTSENLTSFLNLGAMMLGYTPFTLMRCCGWYLGNPLGLHYGEHVEEGVPITDPAFAGVTGHVRALGVVQAQELFQRVGFGQVEVASIGLMPLPDWLGRWLEPLLPRRGHLLLIEARKPGARAKSEPRNPKSEGNPNSAIRSARTIEGHAGPAVARARAVGLDAFPGLRASGFGFPSDFGFRISDLRS